MRQGIRDKWDKGRWPIAYHHAVEMQRILFEHVETPTTSASEKANLARAYCTLEEMKRVITMRPAPKPVDVSPKRIQSVAPATFTEPVVMLNNDASDSVSAAVVPVEPPQNKKP